MNSRSKGARLDALLRELCPCGVEYKKLGEILLRQKGTSITAEKMKEIAVKNGPVRVFAGGKTFVDTDYDHIPEKDINTATSIIVKSRGNIGFEYYEKPFTHKNEFWSYRSSSADINLKYCFYYLESKTRYFQNQAITGKLPQISIGVTDNYSIPVPPMEIQEEIVRILDRWTELEAELEEELEAELEARKAQYEYYRDTLLDFDKTIPRKSLNDICIISAGGDAPKLAMSKEKTDEYTVPIISNGIGDNALYGYTNSPRITEDAVTVSARGTIGFAEYRNYPYFPIIRLLSVIPKNNQELNTRYLFYCLQGKRYNVPTSGIPQLTAPMLKRAIIPVPPMEIQEEIVRILDRFDTLANSAAGGIPAEIEARRRQYEYYRDRLLSFEERRQ